MMPKAHLRGWLTTYLLLAVAAGMLVAVAVTGGRATTAEQESRSFNVLAAFREEEVTRLRVERGQHAFELVRSAPDEAGDTSWRLGPPYDEDAEPFTAEELLGNLRFASYVRQIKPEEVDRAGFGLEAPRWVLHVDMGEIHYRLRLGREAASPKGAAYLEVAGEGAPRKGVVLVGKGLVDELDVDVDDFRGRYVMPYLSPALKGIRIERAGDALELRRASWEGWRFGGMQGDLRVARESLDRVLANFARTKAERFLPEAAARAAVAKAESVSVILTPKDASKPRARVVVGGRCPGQEDQIVALRLEPDVLGACVPEGVLGGFTLPAEVLVDRALFTQRPEDVESLVIEEGSRRLALDRKEDGFVMRAPERAEVDAETGKARLAALLGARGRVVPAPNLEALGLAPPAGKALVKGVPGLDGRSVEEKVEYGGPDSEGRVYVRRDQDGAVIELMREAARGLRPDSSLVRSRRVLSFDRGDVRSVAISGPFEERFAFDVQGAVALEEPKGFSADATLSGEVVDGLRTLTAQAWVAEQDDGSFGLEAPSLTARLVVEPPKEAAQTRTLQVGRAASSGYYARVDAVAGVFVIPRRLHELLGTLVLDRSVFALDAAKVVRIALRGPSGSVELSKHGDEYVQSAGDLQLSYDAVRKIVDALTTLSAEAAVSTGPAPAEAGLREPLLRVEYGFEPGGPPAARVTTWVVGAGDSWRGMSVHYGRVVGMDATYAIPRAMVRAVIDSL